MKFEETLHANLTGKQTYTSISNANALTLYDPITQICKRIEAFFKEDDDITCRFIVNNSKHLPPKLDPDTGLPYTKKIIIDGEQVDAFIDADHLCEFRIFVKDYEKAQCLSNVIRHRHTYVEEYQDTEGNYHVRNHYLIVHVLVLNAIDPDGPEGGNDPWTTDDDTNQGIKEIFGLEPIDWSDYEHSGCNERLSPSDTSESDIPKGYPEEWEQQQWEQTTEGTNWKWQWLKVALKGNKNIIKVQDYVDPITQSSWRFIECNYFPITFQEDNLTSSHGFNSILPADMLPLVFAVFGSYQISTYVRKS